MREILCFLAGMLFASTSIGGVAGYLYAKWRHAKDKHPLSFLVGTLRGVLVSSGAPRGVLIPKGIDVAVLGFGEIADAIEGERFFFAEPPVRVVHPGCQAPPAMWGDIEGPSQ